MSNIDTSKVNLRYDIIGADHHFRPLGKSHHFVEVLKDLGVKYESWEGSHLADCVMLYGCTGIDLDNLPSFLEVWNNIK